MFKGKEFMAFERQWPSVSPRQLTANGGTLGQVQIANTRGFKVGMKAVLIAVGQNNLAVQIKRVMSETLLLVGPVGSPYSRAEWTDISSYTTAASAYIYAEQQEKSKVPANDRDEATFDQEPTVAWRNVLVDQLGRYYETANPLPVRLSDGSVNIGTVNAQLEMFITHRDNDPDAGDVHSSMRIGDGVTEVQNNFGTLANALRTASQIGNATGSANFGAGITGIQTLRVSSNITRNGTELSYDRAASDANTIRTASNMADGSANALTSQASGSQRSLDVGISQGGNTVIADADKNLHVENHGNKPDGTDVVQKLSETGETAIDGTYDVTNNTNPANIGLVTQERNIAASDIRQNLKPTSKRGTVNTDTVSLDVSLHDENGNNYGENNPLTVEPSDDLLDAFGRARHSENNVFFYEHFSDSAHDEDFSYRLLTGGTRLWEQSMARIKLSVTTASGSQATLQSKRYFQYLPGQSLLAIFTGVLPAPKTNMEATLGMNDDSDGIFFKVTSTGMSIVKRSSTSGAPIDTIVPRASWNRDTVDGNGPSGINVDFTKGQIFVIDLEWLGLGNVRIGVFYRGRIIYCHEFDNFNLLTTPYMQRGSLPVRYSVYNTGVTASATDLMVGCVSLSGEGSVKVGKTIGNASTQATPKNITAAKTPVLGIRLQSTYAKSELEPASYSLFSTDTNTSFYYEIVVNPTSITGASWTNIADSIAQQEVAGTAYTGGKVIESGYILGRTGGISFGTINTSYRMGTDINGVADIVLIVVRTLSGNGSILASLTYKEIF